MQAVYASTHPAGMGGLAQGYLSARLPDARLIRALDGLLIYASAARPAALRRLAGFAASYRVVAAVEGELAELAAALSPARLGRAVAEAGCAPRLRVMFRRENQPVAVPEALRQRAEGVIRAAGCAIDRTHPAGELVCLRRSEGLSLALLRLTPARPQAHPGQLKADLASLMVFAAGDIKGRRVADPCCGWGGLLAPLAAAGAQVIASDVDPACVQFCRGLGLPGVQVCRADIFAPGGAQWEGVVTDPPWGSYQALPEDFYPRLLDRLAQRLLPGGRAVLLTARDADLSGGPLPAQALADPLVSGKKARLWVLEKPLQSPGRDAIINPRKLNILKTMEE